MALARNPEYLYENTDFGIYTRISKCRILRRRDKADLTVYCICFND